MPNKYSSIVAPEAGVLAPRYLFKRPNTVSWADVAPSFSPGLGQSIRIRETYSVSVTPNNLTTVYTNANRYLANTNIGYWQHLYVNSSGEYTVEREGQMNAPVSDPNPTIITHTSSYEWDYKLFRFYKDFYGSTYGSVDACNADLEPAAVPNTFIKPTNVIDYVKITGKLAGKNFVGAITDLVEILNPTTAGYRFPDKKNLFNVYNQLPVVDLESRNLGTAIGDLGLWVGPGFSLVGCSHSIEVREFGVLEKLENQLVGAACTYLPGFEYPFGAATSACSLEFQSFIASYSGYFATEAACLIAADATGIPGFGCQPLTHVCSTDPSVLNTYYIFSGGT